jgi:eukaryotic-like serine/threonine-protein kinase
MGQDLTRDKVGGDALFIIKNIRDNTRLSRSNKLADVKVSLENSVSLEFDNYFFFLRKFHYIAMDREAQLKLSDLGERVIDGDGVEKFTAEVAEFFQDQISDGAAAETTVSFSSDVLENRPMLLPPSRAKKVGQPAEEVPGLENRSPFIAPQIPPPPLLAPMPLPLTAVAPMGSSPSGIQSSGPKGTDLDLRFQKFEQLGTGPLGTVYKGRHNALGIDVCVKELKDIFGYFSFLQRGEVIKRLKKELCAQAQIKHPGIVQMVDQNTDVARPYYVMELCRGNLKEKLDATQGKGLAVNLAVRYFLQLAYGLRAAHQQGLTHHNIKPENVLFDAFGNAKLGDFGLSRVIEVDQSKGMPQVFVGTGGMAYMSPELIGRGKDISIPSDVYALGILLYEMMTGQIPGRRSPLPSELNKECPPKIDAIFDKMTQDRRESRYADFDAVFSDFYAAFGDKTYLNKGDLILSSELA